MNMEWAPVGCEAKDEATWTVLVRGIVFDDFPVFHRLFDLSRENPAQDTLIQRMERILVLITTEEFTDQLDHSATGVIVTQTQFSHRAGAAFQAASVPISENFHRPKPRHK